MGEKQYPTGVRPYGSGIQIRFSCDKKRYEPIWPRKPSPKNLAAASALRAEIVLRAKSGILTLEYLADHFPEYAHAREHSETNPKYLFGAIAQDLLDNSDLPFNTRKNYKSRLNTYVMADFGHSDVRSITPGHFAQWVRDTEFSSPSAKSGVLTAVRRVFNLAIAYGYIDTSPADSVKMPKASDGDPDPLTPEERDKLLDHIESRHPGSRRPVYLYYVIGFWTGMRPSEIVALQLRDVSLESRSVMVTKTMTAGGVQSRTKTRVVRRVAINDFALPAFQELMELGKGLDVSHRLIWTPRAPDGYKDISKFSARLSEAFKKVGIRERSTYCMRHTYATACLMAGMNPAFVAQQLGNTLPVLLKFYARWVTSDVDSLEMAKLGK